MQHKRYGHHFKQTQHGFTIVELLIVVVVIAILAAITIVAYNGITQRANASALQSAAESAAKKVATYALTNNDVLPPDLATVGISNSGSVTYQYSVNTTTTPQGYCITTTNNNVAYYVGSNYVYSGGTINQMNPASGTCPGHSGTGVAITNYSQNPGIEVSAANLVGQNSTTIARDTSKAHSGAASLLVTMPQQATTVFVGTTIFNFASMSPLTPSSTYTVTAWVWVPSSTVDVVLSIQGAGKASATNPPARTVTAKNQWTIIQNTFTTSASGGIAGSILNNASTPVAGTQFWVDDVMLTDGTSPANYADGSSPGWVWNGTSGVSSSTGPAL